MDDWPSVTIVFVVYNRRDALRTSLHHMREGSDYKRDRVEIIVVDNASVDGAAAMVRDEFPEVRLIVREENIGASAWNDGFAIAQGDFILVLDDDCYLPPDGLGRAVTAAAERSADLVSFSVASTVEPAFRFTDEYRTGLFSFWGCAWLVRTPVIQGLRGYDPEIFIWANEVEFMLRFFDDGFRHLHLPEVVAQHMKPPGKWLDERPYRIGAKNLSYVAAKLLRPRDAGEALAALLVRAVRDGLRVDRAAFKALPDILRGFLHGLRYRQPVANPRLSRFYRHNFEHFASPWWLSRSPVELIRALPRELLADRGRTRGVGRHEEFYTPRAAFYPGDQPQTLAFAPDPIA